MDLPDKLTADVKRGGRALWRAPTFFVVAVLTLSLGIAANLTVFSFLHAAILKPLPYPTPDTLVRISPSTSYLLALLRDQSTRMEGVSAHRVVTIRLDSGDPPVIVSGRQVSSNLFDLLGVSPILGRAFAPDEYLNEAPVAILSHAFWQAQFGADPDALGKTLRVGTIATAGESVSVDGSYVIVGVMPENFRFPVYATQGINADFWIPFEPNATTAERVSPRGVARLRAGVSLREAQAELDTLVASVRTAYPELEVSVSGSRLTPLGDEALGAGHAETLWTLQVLVALVMVIAVLNVAHLFLSRTADRRAEFHLRVALGAGRLQLFRHLLSESLLVGLFGGIVGLFLAVWATRLVITLLPADIPRLNEVGINLSEVAFTFGLASLTAIGCALMGITGLRGIEKRWPMRDGASREWWRSTFVFAQVSIAFLLLVTATALVDSFRLLTRENLGFQPDRVLAIQPRFLPLLIPDRSQNIPFFEQVLERLDRLPEVDAVGAVSPSPEIVLRDSRFRVDGLDQPLSAGLRTATDRYFEAMSVPLLEGRTFGVADNDDDPRSVIVSKTVANRLRATGTVLGRQITERLGPASGPFFDGETMMIVGVVGDVRLHHGLESASTADVYKPLRQSEGQAMLIVLRSEASLETLIPAVRREFSRLDVRVPVTIEPLTETLSDTVASHRFRAGIAGAFAVVAFGLTLAGVFGMARYTVVRRLPESALRIALGAQPDEVLAWMLRRTMLPVFGGLALGLIGSHMIGRMLGSYLYGVTPTDISVLGWTIGVFVSASLLACYFPVRRVVRADPADYLRRE